MARSKKNILTDKNKHLYIILIFIYLLKNNQVKAIVGKRSLLTLIQFRQEK